MDLVARAGMLLRGQRAPELGAAHLLAGSEAGSEDRDSTDTEFDGNER